MSPAAGEAGGAAASQAQRVGIGADARQDRAADRAPAVGRWGSRRALVSSRHTAFCHLERQLSNAQYCNAICAGITSQPRSCPPLAHACMPPTHPAKTSSCWLAPACLMEATSAPLPCFTAAPALRSRLPSRPLEPATAVGSATPTMRTPCRALRSATCASGQAVRLVGRRHGTDFVLLP